MNIPQYLQKERERLITARDEMNSTIDAIDRLMEYSKARYGDTPKRGRPPLLNVAELEITMPPVKATKRRGKKRRIVHKGNRVIRKNFVQSMTPGFWGTAITDAIRAGANKHLDVWALLERTHKLGTDRKGGFYAAMTMLIKRGKVRKSPTGILTLTGSSKPAAKPAPARGKSNKVIGAQLDAQATTQTETEQVQ